MISLPPDHKIESYLEDSDEEERFSMDQGRQEEGDNLVWDFQNVSQHSGPVPIPSSVMGRFSTNFSKDLETGDTPTLKDLTDFGLYHHESYHFSLLLDPRDLPLLSSLSINNVKSHTSFPQSSYMSTSLQIINNWIVSMSPNFPK